LVLNYLIWLGKLTYKSLDFGGVLL